MKTLYLKKSKESVPGKCNLILTVCITSIFFSVIALVSTASAQVVLFDFDNAPLYSPLPIDQTVCGITAHFSGTGQGYSIQLASVLGFTPQGFSGRCIYPSSVYLADLLVSFDQTLTNFSIMYAPEEYACDNSAMMRVTAYMDGSYVGTNTKTASNPGTWPVDTLSCSFPQGFNSVVVHYDSPPPGGGDYGPVFMADNMKVTASLMTVTGNVVSTQVNCYNAAQTITIAGGTTPFIVETGGSASMIAGQNIIYLPGTTVQPGGYMLGKIFTGLWCGQLAPAMVSPVTGEDELPVASQQPSFFLYPNPTTGKFTLEQKGEKILGKVKVEIYGMRGERVMNTELTGEKIHEFLLSDLLQGLYFVKVLADDYVETFKMVITR
jgi:Secretion system C-terminal sorting domain